MLTARGTGSTVADDGNYGVTYGFRKPIAGADVCERQSGVLCGQHAINNLLQETKIISLPGNPNFFVSVSATGALGYTKRDGSCFTILDVLDKRQDIKINMRATCFFDPTHVQYCHGNDRGYYEDTAFEYVLQNLLRYTYTFINTQAVDYDAAVAEVKTKLSREFNIGIIINLGNGHWTCITKGMATPADRPYAYLDSSYPTYALCLSNEELDRLFNDARRRILGFCVIDYTDGKSYNSIAKQNIETRRVGAAAIATRAAVTSESALSNYVFETTGRRFNFQSGDKRSDALKALRLSRRGPRTAEELQRIAITRNFLDRIVEYLPDYEGYPSAATATATEAPAATLVTAPPAPANTTGTIGSLVSGLTSKLGFGRFGTASVQPASKTLTKVREKPSANAGTASVLVSAPIATANDDRLQQLSKVLGNSVNDIKAAYKPSILEKMYKDFGISSKVKTRPTTIAAPVAAPVAPVAAPVTTSGLSNIQKYQLQKLREKRGQKGGSKTKRFKCARNKSRGKKRSN